jgi:hypothetical protein
LKWILIVIMVTLMFGAGGRRLFDLLRTFKRLPSDYRDGRHPPDPSIGAKQARGRIEPPHNEIR